MYKEKNNICAIFYSDFIKAQQYAKSVDLKRKQTKISGKIYLLGFDEKKWGIVSLQTSEKKRGRPQISRQSFKWNKKCSEKNTLEKEIYG